MGLRFRTTKTKTWGQESIPVQNAFFVILSRNPTYKSEAASLLFQSNMRGKFTRGNPREFQHQISPQSETEQIDGSVVPAETREV